MLRLPTPKKRNKKWQLRAIEAQKVPSAPTSPDSPSSQRSDPRFDRKGSSAQSRGFGGRGKGNTDFRRSRTPPPRFPSSPGARFDRKAPSKGKGKGKGKGEGKGKGSSSRGPPPKPCLLCGAKHWIDECQSTYCTKCKVPGHSDRLCRASSSSSPSMSSVRRHSVWDMS